MFHKKMKALLLGRVITVSQKAGREGKPITGKVTSSKGKILPVF